LLSPRQPVDALVELVGDAHPAKGGLDTRHVPRRDEGDYGPQKRPVAEPSGVDVVHDAERAHEIELLTHGADPPLDGPQLALWKRRQVVPEDLHPTGGRTDGPVEQPEQRALSRTTGAHEGDPFPGADVEIDVRQGGERAEAHAHLLQPEDGRIGQVISPLFRPTSSICR
jgi:hypothetical protein